MKRSRAFCLVRSQPQYRREAFESGLKACGYELLSGGVWWPARPGDVLVTWNRYGDQEQIADRFEKEGGTVLVAENGYLGRDEDGRQFYAIARGGHNGQGWWPEGGPERWTRLNVDLRPLRRAGDYILVCPNREFGRRGFIQPWDWANTVARQIKRLTPMPVLIRPHPGNWQSHPPKVPLERDLERAYACVIWSSSCGVHALVAGVPVLCDCPAWICKDAAASSWLDLHQRLDDDNAPRRGALGRESAVAIEDERRRRALERLAWAQWTVDEIASGRPFALLLSDTRQAESSVGL